MFVLAHLSDPHLGPVPLPRFRELTGKRALGFVNWHRRRFVRHRPEALEALVHDLRSAAPDHIAVTGDLVNIALEKEFPPAREWLSRLGSPHDVSMVPGNHDAYVRDAIEHPASHWGDYMRGDGIGTGAPHSRSGPFPYVRRRGPAALIGLSTALPTAPFLATGKLGADQLMRLSDALAHLAHEGLFRIVLIHHPPAAPSRCCTATTTCIRSPGSGGRSTGSRSSGCRRPRRRCAGTAIRPATTFIGSTARPGAGAAR